MAGTYQSRVLIFCLIDRNTEATDKNSEIMNTDVDIMDDDAKE